MDAETVSAIRRLKPDGRSNLLWHNTKTGKDSFPSNARKAVLFFNKTLDSLCHFESFEQTEALNETDRLFNPDSDKVTARRFSVEK